ncbi:LysR family transcriptional regulator [Janthinobacterium agaricidamnosum]|uniref:Bacterial regulatory helix-turn-helix, lysR family protein n=1 Tax=Janthinobacterium agaricidamnosum NBRC 102515 = DSM 9628 TaxID=1349767 RepID=W0V4M8_9BURK|nr:LysR family transcriptional regulator [Janthinobacterium agaricidamnosum]CDG82831.1 bacterial regulatory helix-turn-helix, lysR family protein [Janthinobacterium agaricidamnosum NBRC 102515 = DSM 9628]
MSIKLMWEIRAFCTVVDKRSFVHAARMLGCSPSAVTRAIQYLEEAIGAELILRTQKQFTLTMAGTAYHVFAQQLLETQAEAEDQLSELSNSPQGWVRISAPEILSLGFLPKVVAKFSRDYPSVSIDINFTDKTVDPIEEKLDFAIRGAFPRSSELIGYELWKYRRYMYASPDYLDRMGIPHEPEDLAAYDVVIHTAPRILRDWHFVSLERTVRYQVKPRYRFTSGIAVLHVALEGAGIARLGSWLAEPLVKEGKLVRVCAAYHLTSSKGLDPSIHAVYGSPKLAKGARLFLEQIRKHAAGSIPDERGR